MAGRGPFQSVRKSSIAASSVTQARVPVASADAGQGWEGLEGDDGRHVVGVDGRLPYSSTDGPHEEEPPARHPLHVAAVGDSNERPLEIPGVSDAASARSHSDWRAPRLAVAP